MLLVVWEVLKAIGGDRWQVDSFLGTGIVDRLHAAVPVRRSRRDVKLPHTWDIAAEFVAVDDAGDDDRCERLFGAALFTLRNAAIGFTLGAMLGLGLAIVLVHVRILERSLVPDHRGQPDHPDHRHRAAHRHRAQGGLVRRRDRGDLPDVLPGHDRRACAACAPTTRARWS